MIKIPSLEQLKNMSKELVDTIKSSDMVSRIKKGSTKSCCSHALDEQTKKMESDIETLVKAHKMMSSTVLDIKQDVQNLKEFVLSLCTSHQDIKESKQSEQKKEKTVGCCCGGHHSTKTCSSKEE